MSPRARHAAAWALLAALAAGLGYFVHARRARSTANAAAHADWRVRANRVLDLALAGDARGVSSLYAAVGDPNSAVRDNALFGLRRHTGMAWGSRTAECRAWWTSRAAEEAPPAALLAFDPLPEPDPALVPGLTLLSPSHVRLTADAPPLAVRWTLENRGGRARRLLGAPRDVHWAYRFPPEGGGLLQEESLLPYTFATVVVRAVLFDAAGQPRELGAEAGSSLEGVSLEANSCLDGTAAFPLPGAGDEAAGFLVARASLRVEPWFVDGLGLLARRVEAAPPAVVLTARPPWNPRTPHLTAPERVRMPEQAADAGLRPASLAIFVLQRGAAGPSAPATAGTEPNRAWTARASGPVAGVRPLFYLAGIGWVRRVDSAEETVGTAAPLLPTLHFEGAAPDLPAAPTFCWGVEFE